MRHLTNIQSCSNEVIEEITSSAYMHLHNKAQNKGDIPILKDKFILNLFFENSTRTLASFNMAGTSLGANVINLPMKASSITKGESFYDTIKTLDSMEADFLVIRHSQNGWPDELSNVNAQIINAGEGTISHPTQALTDYAVIKQHLGSVEGKKIAICGDLKHSRVTNSNVELLTRFGANVVLAAPEHFSPNQVLLKKASYTSNFYEAIQSADIVMMLRVQTERHEGHNKLEQNWQLNQDVLQQYCPNALIMHPGPVNRGVELAPELMEHKQSLILQQVKMGVAVRKAIFELLNKCN